MRLSDKWLKAVEDLIRMSSDPKHPNYNPNFNVQNLVRIVNPRSSPASWHKPAKLQKTAKGQKAAESIRYDTFFMMRNFDYLCDEDKQRMLADGIPKEEAWNTLKGKSNIERANKELAGDNPDEADTGDTNGGIGWAVGGYYLQQAIKRQATSIDNIIGDAASGYKVDPADRLIFTDIWLKLQERAQRICNDACSLGVLNVGKQSIDINKVRDKLCGGDQIAAQIMVDNTLASDPDHLLADYKDAVSQGKEWTPFYGSKNGVKGWAVKHMKGKLVSMIGQWQKSVEAGGKSIEDKAGFEDEDTLGSNLEDKGSASAKGGSERGGGGGGLGATAERTGPQEREHLLRQIQNKNKIRTFFPEIQDLIKTLIQDEMDKGFDEKTARENVLRNNNKKLIDGIRDIGIYIPAGTFDISDILQHIETIRLEKAGLVAQKAEFNTLEDLKDLSKFRRNEDATEEQIDDGNTAVEAFAEDLKPIADQPSIADIINALRKKQTPPKMIEKIVLKNLRSFLSDLEDLGTELDAMKMYWIPTITTIQEMLGETQAKPEPERNAEPESKPEPEPELEPKPQALPAPITAVRNAQDNPEVAQALASLKNFGTKLATNPRLILGWKPNELAVLRSKLREWIALTKHIPEAQTMYRRIIEICKSQNVTVEMSLPMGYPPYGNRIRQALGNCANVWGVPNQSTGVGPTEGPIQHWVGNNEKKKFKSLKEYLNEHSLDHYKKILMERVESTLNGK